MPRSYKARSLYMGKGNSYSTECFRVCSDCGATVFIDDTETHSEFHDKIDELIDWAQNVSEYFVERHGTPTGGGIREILHRINDGIIAPGEAMARSGIELQKGPDTPD